MGLETQSDNTGSPADKTIVNPLSRKINKILETRLENDKAAVEALKELSNFFPENSLKARRNLRGQIEHRTVTINEDFVAALKEVKDAVDNIYADVKSINASCSQMKAKLQAAKAETRHLTEQTARLHKQRELLSMQQQVATAFTNTFLLTSAELACLKCSSECPPTVGPTFFAALDKTQTIRTNTKLLLQTGHQTTALDVMSQCSEVREAAITGLYQWLLQQARHPDTVSAHVPKAMTYMEDRPQLFKLVVEEWVVIRRGALHRQLLHSLTHLSPTHSPIELGAHSPTRYVGDMLAWLHQALAGERELMGALFGACTNIDVGEQTCKSVASIAESVCRPLKTRIEQMIVSSEQSKTTPASSATSPPSSDGRRHAVSSNSKPVMLYKMSGLLQFYKNTIEQLTGPGVLVCTVEELQLLSHKMFLASLNAQVELGCERLPPPPPSLTPAEEVSSLLSLLSDVITAATLLTASDHASQVVDMVVSPLLGALENSCRGVSVVEGCVYLLNCYHTLHSTVSLLHTNNCEEKLKQIEELMDSRLAELSAQQSSSLEASLGIQCLVPHLKLVQPNDVASLSAVPHFNAPVLHSFSTKLEHYLSMPDSYLLPPLAMLTSSAQRQKVMRRVSEGLLEQYRQLHSFVHHPASGFHNPDHIISKQPDTIKALMMI